MFFICKTSYWQNLRAIEQIPFDLACSSLSVPFSEKIVSRKQPWKNFPASQTNSAHKHSLLGSHITEPISACSQRDSRENRHGWLHIRQQVAYGLSIRHESFTSGKNEKPYFLRHHLIFLRSFFLDESSCVDLYIYLKIKISAKWSVWKWIVTLGISY